MARMKRVDVPDDYKPHPRPAVQVDATATAEAEKAAAPPVPTGYVSRTITWPAAYWETFDRQAHRGGLSVSKWLEKLLAHMARE